MNEQGKDDNKRQQKHPDMINNKDIEQRLTHFFHEQADKVQFAPEMRVRIMRNLPKLHRLTGWQRLLISAAAIAAVFVLTLSLILFTAQYKLPIATGPHYVISQSQSVASELAQGGELLSVDPTEQHIVYQKAHEAEVLYVADLHDPLQTNTLAMRYARDMAWSSDGSALVATVSPEGSHLPLLALVPTGQYMHAIGPNALAASWIPNTKQHILYAVQTNGQTQLWQTDSNGQNNKLDTIMPISFIIQHMYWSPDGHQLAFVAAPGSTLSKGTLNQPGRTVYIMNVQTHALNQIVLPGPFTINNASWSPNSQDFTYEQTDSNGKMVLQTIDVAKSKLRFSIAPQHRLQGWSWSPDNQTIVYSDSGTLRTFTISGPNPSFLEQGKLVSPFWLKDGRILCIQITNGTGKLTLLSTH